MIKIQNNFLVNYINIIIYLNNNNIFIYKLYFDCIIDEIKTSIENYW